MSDEPAFMLPPGRWGAPATARYTAMDVAEALAIPLQARFAGLRRRRWVRVALVLLLIAMIGDAALEWPNWGVGALPGLALFAILATGRLPPQLLLPFAWLEMRGSRTWRSDTVIRLGEAGLYCRAGGSAGVTLWPEIGAWGEGSFVLALRKSGTGSLVVPKRALSVDQLDDIRSALAASGVPRWGERPARTAPALPAMSAPGVAAGPRTIVFTLRPDEVIAANRRMSIVRMGQPRTLVVAALYAAIAYLGGFSGPVGDPAAALPTALAIGLGGAIATLGLLPWLAAPWLTRRAFRLRRGFQVPTTLSWSDTRVDAMAETGGFHQPWPSYRRWRETAAAILLHQSAATFQLIPKRALDAAQADDLRHCAQRANVPGA